MYKVEYEPIILMCGPSRDELRFLAREHVKRGDGVTPRSPRSAPRKLGFKKKH